MQMINLNERPFLVYIFNKPSYFPAALQVLFAALDSLVSLRQSNNSTESRSRTPLQSTNNENAQ